MTRHQTKVDWHPLLDSIRRFRVFYEIHPELALQPEDAPASWFEIALHAEAEEPWPPDAPRSREAFSALMDMADFLVQRIGSHAPYSLEVSASYHTLHPPASGGLTRPGLARTVSLVFSDVGPCTRLEEPAILTQIRDELHRVGIPRLDRFSGG
jgi:hypothetical protein